MYNRTLDFFSMFISELEKKAKELEKLLSILRLSSNSWMKQRKMQKGNPDVKVVSMPRKTEIQC